jgi:hypothetical protein
VKHAHIDLRGDISGDYKESNVPHYQTFRFERRRRGFGAPGNMGNPYARREARGYKSIGEYNTILWRGGQFACGIDAGRFTVYTSNTGHGGVIECPGVAQIRRGKGGHYSEFAAMMPRSL